MRFQEVLENTYRWRRPIRLRVRTVGSGWRRPALLLMSPVVRVHTGLALARRSTARRTRRLTRTGRLLTLGRAGRRIVPAGRIAMVRRPRMARWRRRVRLEQRVERRRRAAGGCRSTGRLAGGCRSTAWRWLAGTAARTSCRRLLRHVATVPPMHRTAGGGCCCGGGCSCGGRCGRRLPARMLLWRGRRRTGPARPCTAGRSSATPGRGGGGCCGCSGGRRRTHTVRMVIVRVRVRGAGARGRRRRPLHVRIVRMVRMVVVVAGRVLLLMLHGRRRRLPVPVMLHLMMVVAHGRRRRPTVPVVGRWRRSVILAAAGCTPAAVRGIARTGMVMVVRVVGRRWRPMTRRWWRLLMLPTGRPRRSARMVVRVVVRMGRHVQRMGRPVRMMRRRRPLLVVMWMRRPVRMMRGRLMVLLLLLLRRCDRSGRRRRGRGGRAGGSRRRRCASRSAGRTCR